MTGTGTAFQIFSVTGTTRSDARCSIHGDARTVSGRGKIVKRNLLRFLQLVFPCLGGHEPRLDVRHRRLADLPSHSLTPLRFHRVNFFLSRRVTIAFLALLSIAAPVVAQQPAATAPVMPDPKLTPGDVLDVTLADIQVHGYSSKVRNVPVSEKRAVYASYGIHHWSPGEYEVDHLVSLSLGGSNSKKNLWPESRLTEPWNAQVKDQLEFKLLELVRDGKVDLHTAQQEMAHDWIAAYKKYVSAEPRAEHAKRPHEAEAARDGEADIETVAETASATTTQGSAVTAAGQVWVNTKSGVIWKPGSAYYGKTKTGKYMSEADALAAGYHEAK